MPLPPPRAPQQTDTGPVAQEELQRAYDLNHSTSPQAPIDTLRGHFQELHLNRLFAVAPLPHGATSVYVRHLQAFLTPGERVPDNLVDVWIWWFNVHHPEQGRVWVPHLA